MPDNMTSGYIRLNGRLFNEDNLKTNMLQLSHMENLSYPTVLRYITPSASEAGNREQRTTQEVKNFRGEALYAILINGLGFTVEEAQNLKLGDVFDFIQMSKNGKVT